MRTLILNASYEPLGVVSTRRAIILVLNDKARVVAAADDRVHAEHLTLQAPAVVLLTRYVRVPTRVAPLTRRAVLQRYDSVCAYCGKYGDTLDHVLPRSRGGAHEWTNVVVACRRCNNIKADSLLSEIGWTLPFEPTAPAATTSARVAMMKTLPTWDPFLEGWAGSRDVVRRRRGAEVAAVA